MESGRNFPEKFTLSASSCIFVRPTVCVRWNRSKVLSIRFPVVVSCARIGWCGTCELTTHLNQYYAPYRAVFQNSKRKETGQTSLKYPSWAYLHLLQAQQAIALPVANNSNSWRLNVIFTIYECVPSVNIFVCVYFSKGAFNADKDNSAMVKVVRPTSSPNLPLGTELKGGCIGILTQWPFDLTLFHKIVVIFCSPYWAENV